MIPRRTHDCDGHRSRLSTCPERQAPTCQSARGRPTSAWRSIVSTEEAMMRAIRQHAFGPPETLRYEEAADPVPGDGQVRIAVEAAGVHFLDTMIRRGAAGGPL